MSGRPTNILSDGLRDHNDYEFNKMIPRTYQQNSTVRLSRPLWHSFRQSGIGLVALGVPGDSGATLAQHELRKSNCVCNIS